MKANYQQQNRPSRLIQAKRSQPVTQKKAWVITRELNLGFSGSSSNSKSSSFRAPYEDVPAGSLHGIFDSSGAAVFSGVLSSPIIAPVASSNQSTAGSSGNGSKHATSGVALSTNTPLSPNANHIINQPTPTPKVDLTLEKSTWNKIKKLKFHHRHILFDDTHMLPIVGWSNNIGYGGILYKESSLDGYVKGQALSYTKRDDINLLLAIYKHEDFGEYNLLTNNCQHWVNKVYKSFKKIKRADRAVRNLAYGQNHHYSF